MDLPANNFLTITTPFGVPRERRSSARYFWDNSQRGNGDFVIIQKSLSDHGVFTWEGKSWEVPAEHAFIAIVPEHSAYGYPTDTKVPWEFSWLNLYGPLGTRLSRELRSLFGPVLPLPSRSPAGQAFDVLIGKARQRTAIDPFDLSQGCYGFLMEWARQLSDPSLSNRDPVDAASRICQTRFREPLSVKELAWETGISREHLTRLFTERHGLSPARYLRQLRTEEARRMRLTLGTSLKEAALRCGFPSARALSRALAD
ncbi:hypothetical protein BH09VER1_BH09VER1_06300 [soil metagenome]